MFLLYLVEAGSKCIGTLEIAGALSVKLKSNHAASRERVSIMTWVTSNKHFATCSKRPPIELLFKAKSSRRTASLICPDGTSVAVTWAPLGSYREENIIAYLRRWLDPWTAERKASGDYRLLYLDVAKCHLGSKVAEVAWERGYVLLYHYGCTTGVAQVNDTDCHAAFESEYLEFEQISFNRRQSICPGDVNRTAQELLEDVVATWRTIKHEQGVAGHKRRGLSNNLNGDEDEVMAGEARDLWIQMDMGGARRDCIQEVDAVLKVSGNLREVGAGASTPCEPHYEPDDFSRFVQEFVRHPVDPGAQEHEGQELEPLLAPGESCWESAAEGDLRRKEDADPRAGELDLACADAALPSEALGPRVAAQEGDDPGEVAAAEALAAEMANLEAIRELAEKARLPAAAQQAETALARLRHGFRSKRSSQGQVVNRVLKRHCENRFRAEAAKLERKREAMRKQKHNALKIRALKAKAKAEKECVAKAKAEKDKKANMLSKHWSLGAVQGHEPGKKKNRLDMLERMKLGSPDLPEDLESSWPRIKVWYESDVVKKNPANHGVVLITMVNSVLEQMGEHYQFASTFKSTETRGKSKPDKKAFTRFVRRWFNDMPKPVTTVFM